MIKATMQHPEHKRLMQYADGELREAARKEVFGHLVTCSECRAWLDDLETGAADYARDWLPIANEASEPPPAPWFDLRGKLAGIDRLPAKSFRLRPRWVAAAAGIVLALAAAYRLSEQPVSAAGLLREAVKRERQADRPRPPIRVVSRSGTVTRPALWGASREAGDRTRQLRALFEAANYSWDDPLSARSFVAWRATLQEPQDRVVKRREGDGSSSYEISTQTASGALVEARLALRVSDLQPTQTTLRFRNNEVVEIAEVPAGLSNPPTTPPAQVIRETEKVDEPVTPGEELRVWVALRRIDADLGEPIQVERDTSVNAIVVTGLGLTAERRRTLEDAVGSLPRTQLRFRDPQPARLPTRSLPGDSSNRQPPLQSELESRFGSRGLAEAFTNRILEAGESALLRAHAMRELARRFPPETQLSSNDQTVLRSLLAEHFAALDTATRRVIADGQQITAVEVAPARLPARSWQSHAESLVEAIERADQILTRLLAVAGDAGSRPAELEQALNRVAGEIAAAEPAFRETR